MDGRRAAIVAPSSDPQIGDMLVGMWTKLLPLLCALAASVWAQSDDPKELLMRVRDNLMATIARMPRYMCTQTIDRAQYAPTLQSQDAQRLVILSPAASCDNLLRPNSPARPKLTVTDRLRLDVAIANSNEIYSWVGESRFDNRDLFQMVRDGAVQTGSFSGFLGSIFARDAASFSYNGDITVDGRPLVEFGYEVPPEKSNYIFGNRIEHVTSGFGGTFLVDPKTFDLVRLVVRTSGLSPEVGACQATTTLDYGRVRLNDSNFLLPSEAQLEIVNIDGSEIHNRTVYSACHEFLGESTLSFGEPPPSPDAPAGDKAPATAILSLPAGLTFKLQFTQPIDAAVAAAGDKIGAKLTSAIRDTSSNQILVPEGSSVTARIVRLEHFAGPPSSLTIAVKLESVGVGGTPRPLLASKGSNTKRFEKGAGLTQRVDLGSFAPSEDLGVGVFEFRSVKDTYVVKSGLESAWTTLGPQ